MSKKSESFLTKKNIDDSPHFHLSLARSLIFSPRALPLFLASFSLFLSSNYQNENNAPQPRLRRGRSVAPSRRSSRRRAPSPSHLDLPHRVDRLALGLGASPGQAEDGARVVVGPRWGSLARRARRRGQRAQQVVRARACRRGLEGAGFERGRREDADADDDDALAVFFSSRSLAL